jgi:hypothetical protein
MSLAHVFTRIDNSVLAELIRSTSWGFPVIEAVHLLGLALIGGAVLMLDLRLLGFSMRRQPVARVARDAHPWLVAGLFVMLPTGFLLFVSEAVKCYQSAAFWVKMTSLFLAIVFTFTVRRRVANADEGRVAPLWTKVVALVSLTLWSGVGWGGRWIGFS